MQRADIVPQLWRPWPIAWETATTLIEYPEALRRMDEEVAAIAKGDAPERVWLLEHPPLYTAGTSASEADLLDGTKFPVFRTGRGGQFTYHGPGQRVAYVMLDLRRRGSDVRAFVTGLEDWIIGALAELGVSGERREDRVGVWVRRRDDAGEREDKIAAIGIRVRHWVSLHGISLNVAPDLSHFAGIVPCGVTGHGVTSLKDIGLRAALIDADQALADGFSRVFGPITPC